MDHDKPEVVAPQVLEFDVENPEAPAYVEDRRERRGESLW
jgi:hypothetical protein